MSDWRRDVLHAIGAKPTKQNMRFLTTWQRWEGGHTNNDARYNWLNTTKDAPGAVASINSVGVKKFDSYAHGIQATVATLSNSYYDDIVSGLKSGNPYAHDLSRGLQTWVAGPNGTNPGYVAKIMGTGDLPPSTPRRNRPPRRNGNGGGPGIVTPKLDMDLMSIVWDDDPEFLETLRMLNREPVSPGYAPPLQPGKETLVGDHGTKRSAGFLGLPTKWEATHVTDGLGWGTHSAIDIMGDPGTTVGAPEDAVVVYFHASGAQGGGSMLLRTKSGREYWVGHIANGVKAGTRVRRGQRIADISGDHAAPHVHLDRRG